MGLFAEKLASLINEKIEEKDAELHIVEFYSKTQMTLIDYYIRNFSNVTSSNHQVFFVSIEKITSYLQTKMLSNVSCLVIFLEFNSSILSSLYHNISNCQTLISSKLL
jgi:hypothetical protein